MLEPDPSHAELPSVVSDRGQLWVRWTPEVADREPDVAAAVESFEAVDTEAGRAATAWLKERALLDYRSSVTHLMIIEDRVEAYYSLASAQVELRQSDRRKVEAEHPVQPAALITWIAKHRYAQTSGIEVLAHAAGTALNVAEHQGVVALVLDPYDDDTAEMWKRPPYRFKPSRTRAPSGRPRLWRSLLID